MRFDFNPKTNIALRRFLLVVSIFIVSIGYPIAVIESAMLLGQPESFMFVLVAVAFFIAVIPLVAAVFVRRSAKPLARIYQPLALAALPLSTFPMDMVIVLALGSGWLYAHWMLVEFRLWGTAPPEDPKPAPTPMKNYIDTDKGPKSAPVPSKKAQEVQR